MNKKLGNVLSLCDGKGGGLDALLDNGVPPARYFACESDPYAVTAAKAVHPEIVQLGDMRHWAAWPPVAFDMFYMTMPCQKYSIQGARGGLAHDDLIKVGLDMVEAFKPKMIVFENVKGLLSSGGGEVMELITGRLSALGYAFDWKVINAALTSAQARERVYLIACNTVGSLSLPHPQYHGLKIKDILEDEHGEPSRDCAEIIPTMGDYLLHVANATGGKKSHEASARVYSADGCAPTVNTMQGGQREVKVHLGAGKFRYLSLREHFRLMGQHEETIDKLLTSGLAKSRLKKICGNGVERGAFAHVTKCLLTQAGYIL